MSTRLTPAQLHLRRVEARQRAATADAGDFAAVGRAVAASPAARRAPVDHASPARRMMERKSAAIAAAMAPANDNAAPGEGETSAPSAADAAERAAMSAQYQLQLQLVANMRQISDTKSIERKIELKRQFLPDFLPWILGVLESGAGGEDPVVTQGMIWAIDTGDYSLGLELAEHHIRHRIGMPERFKSDIQTWATDTIANAAIAALSPPQGLFPHGVLGRLDLMIEGHDMPDQARAKLQKAMGLECAHLADNPPEGHAVAGWRPSQLEAALACYRRALELDPSVGVKKLIEVLERELKKEIAP